MVYFSYKFPVFGQIIFPCFWSDVSNGSFSVFVGLTVFGLTESRISVFGSKLFWSKSCFPVIGLICSKRFPVFDCFPVFGQVFLFKSGFHVFGRTMFWSKSCFPFLVWYVLLVFLFLVKQNQIFLSLVKHCFGPNHVSLFLV